MLPAGSVASSGGGGASDVSVDPAPGRPPVPRRRRRVSFIEKSKQRLAVVQKYARARAAWTSGPSSAWMLVDLCWCQEQQEGMLGRCRPSSAWFSTSFSSVTADGARTR